ncbi:MAG TPA: PQQ-binding-like beta-propeller repeat protein [Acidimicrobiales bacterium]|nr:PQQ-binding-like beta-propeller repeat protein [Acidimicrobiales bacterium]
MRFERRRRGTGGSPVGGRRGRRTTAGLSVGLLPMALMAGLFGGLASLGPTALPLSNLHLAASATCDDSWAMFQHDNRHTGAPLCSGVTTSNATELHQSWYAQTAGAITAEPVVADGLVFVGDSTGVFYAVDQATGTVAWSFNITSNKLHDDQHGVSFGEIPGTAAVAEIPQKGSVVFVVGGGTVYALEALTGAPIWAQDTDPLKPTSSVETESSPVVDLSTSPPEVLLGNDTNQSSGVAETGMMAFNAETGALLWKYEPETNKTVTPGQYAGSTPAALSAGDDLSTDHSCGDIWSSPALDPRYKGHGLVVFATGDCPEPAPGQFTNVESVFGVDAVTGKDVWTFAEPANIYTSVPTGTDADDDFGSSPVLATVEGRAMVVEAGKSGYVYGLDEHTGKELWQVQAAQPGQLSPQGVGAIGGFIGSPALGTADGHPAVFLTSAIFMPLTGLGANAAAPPYTPCAGLTEASLPACPDTTLAGDPTRLASVHAVDIATGTVLWQEPISTPTYAPATYSNGVVFAPSTTSFAIAAYDADTGVPLWASPLAASAASGASVVGPSIFVGSGISEGGQNVPGANGIWSFTTVLGAPAAPATPGV